MTCCNLFVRTGVDIQRHTRCALEHTTCIGRHNSHTYRHIGQMIDCVPSIYMLLIFLPIHSHGPIYFELNTVIMLLKMCVNIPVTVPISYSGVVIDLTQGLVTLDHLSIA